MTILMFTVFILDILDNNMVADTTCNIVIMWNILNYDKIIKKQIKRLFIDLDIYKPVTKFGCVFSVLRKMCR